jgi:hypothetical protein
MANQYTKQPFDLERAIHLYESGMSQTEVANVLGTTQKVVCKRFQAVRYKCRVAAKRDQFGDRNHQWKGDEASKYAFHRRLYSRYGKPNRCSQCGTEDRSKSYDYATLSGQYENIDDYLPMCRSCHSVYDEKYKNFRGAIGGRPSPDKGGDAVCQQIS